MPSPEDAEDDIATRLWTADLPARALRPRRPARRRRGPRALGVRTPAQAPGGRDPPIRLRTRRGAAGPPAAAAVPPGLHPRRGGAASLQQQVAAEEARAPIDDVAGDPRRRSSPSRPTPRSSGRSSASSRGSAGTCCSSGKAGGAVGLVEILNRTAALPTICPRPRRGRSRRRAPGSSPARCSRRFGRSDGARRGSRARRAAGARRRPRAGGGRAVLPDPRGGPGQGDRARCSSTPSRSRRGGPGALLPFLQRRALVPRAQHDLHPPAHREPRRLGPGAPLRRAPRPAGAQGGAALLRRRPRPGRGAPSPCGCSTTRSPRCAGGRAQPRPAALAGRGADRLLAIAAQPGFGDRELAEREACWEVDRRSSPRSGRCRCCGRCCSSGAGSAQAKELDDTACAGAALRAHRVPRGARAAARGAPRAKRGEAREILEEALRAAARGGARSAAPPEDAGHG